MAAPSMEEVLKNAKALLASQKHFDGVQLVNGALEAYETHLKAKNADLESFVASDILKTPEAFVTKAAPSMEEAAKAAVTSLFAARAQFLHGLGAEKRGLVDLGVALMLAPNDEAICALKIELEGKSIDPTPKTRRGKTPTTIITGFLGAGKTTLLNHILREQHGKRIAIIENEFGEVGIDDSLLDTRSSATEENVVEMNNGCICCTVRGDLIVGLKRLHKQAKQKQKPLDAVIIETTGLADPAPVAQTFFADEYVNAHFMLDGILTVIDAKHVVEHLREIKPDGVVNEAVEQVAFADRLLLNKIDLISSKALEEVKTEIRQINNTAQMRTTQDSRIDMDFILGIEAFSLDKVLTQVNEGFLDEEEGHGHSHAGHGHGGYLEGAGHGHQCGESCDHESHGQGGHGHGGHGHDDSCAKQSCSHPTHEITKKPRHVHDYRVSSVGFTKEAEMKPGKHNEFIQWLMQEKGPDLYRSKGVLAVEGVKQKFVFQAVHMQFKGLPQGEWGKDEKKCCKIVFIGKNLDREELSNKFEECFV